MPMTTRCWIAVVAARKPDVCGAMNATTNRSAARRRLRCCIAIAPTAGASIREHLARVQRDFSRRTTLRVVNEFVAGVIALSVMAAPYSGEGIRADQGPATGE
jgi:hypothetical protein